MKQVSYLFDGVVYRAQGWLGCQLASFEWRRVRAGTKRTINFNDGSRQYITVFTTYDRKWRNWFKVETAWTIGPHEPLDSYNARINEFFDKLNAEL